MVSPFNPAGATEGKYLLTLVDAFSCFLWVYVLSNKTNETVADILIYQHFSPR